MKRDKKLLSLLLAVVVCLGVMPIHLSHALTSDALLSMNYELIKSIGRQPSNSVYCSGYALAYCNAILDGRTHSYAEYWGPDGCIWSNGSYAGYFPANENDALKRIYEEINKGKPVVVKVNSKGGASQHYVTVVGYRRVTSLDTLRVTSELVCKFL